MTGLIVRKWAQHITISAEALAPPPHGSAAGLAGPTLLARRQEFHARMAAKVATDPDPLPRQLLDLHALRWRGYGAGECVGDDMDGYEAENPGWPCRTVALLAGRYGMDVDGLDW